MPGSEMPAFGGVCKDTEPPLNRMLLTELYAGLEKQPTGLGTLPVHVPLYLGLDPSLGSRQPAGKTWSERAKVHSVPRHAQELIGKAGNGGKNGGIHFAG